MTPDPSTAAPDRPLLGPLLADEPVVVTAGVALFEETLAAQAVRSQRVDWRPPAPGSEGALARVLADPRRRAANETAVTRLMAAQPRLIGLDRAGPALGLGPGDFLHAGPPVDWERASGPLRGALIGAMLYEGFAATPAEAADRAAAGDISLAPCHSRGAVGPMAGVVSASMPVLVVGDEVSGGTAYCTLNEGLGKVLRYGAYGPEVVERLHWMARTLAPVLSAALGRHGPVDITALIAQALQMGDEGHNRNRAATSLLIREIVADIVECGAATADIAAVIRFLNGNDHFFLNLAMPAAKVAADAARDVPGSSMVVAMARNGTDFGIQVAGTGDRWFTAPASVVDGLYLGGFGPADANPDIGDSTITETFGIGGLAMAAAPAIVRFVGGQVGDALTATRTMYDITLAENPAFQIPILEFRGTPTGLDVVKIVRTGIVPMVNTGIAGRVPGVGQVGAGLVTPPMAVFADAVQAVAAAAPELPDR